MTRFLVDTHSHLHFPAYDADRDAVLSRMKDEGIATITIGTSIQNSKKAVALAEAHDGIWAAVALHPEHVSSSFQDPDEGSVIESSLDDKALEVVARSSKKVVAIGETGLDFHYLDQVADPEAVKKQQEETFRAHMALARKLKLPLIIHCRDAMNDMLRVIKNELASGGPLSGVMHSFAGTWEDAQKFLDLGFYLGVNGIATFPPKKKTDPRLDINQTLKRLPLDRLLLETDAPYLAPVPHRGQRNEPAFVAEVAKYAASARGLSLEEMARITTANALALFKLDKK